MRNISFLILCFFLVKGVSQTAMPTLVSPSNGSTNEDVSVTLDWTAVTGNNGYLYEIDTTPLFNSPLHILGNSAINSSQATVSNLRFGTTYYWRSATKGSSDTSAWTSTWSFTTSDQVTPVSPSNGDINEDVSVTLDWTPITGNNGYIYEIDTTPLFNSSLYILGNSGVNSSQASVSDLRFGTTYYWRAATKTLSDTSMWSTTWSFTTSDQVTPVSPSNGAINEDVSVTLDWTPITGNNGYIYEIDTTPLFNSSLYTLGNSGINSSQANVDDLRFGTTYYWRAATKTLSDTSMWSTTWSFTTSDQVTLVSPSNGATNRPVSLTLDWTAITGNSGYIYEIDTTLMFNSPLYLLGNSNTNTSQASVSGLKYGSVYYWRAAAKNNVDTSLWSSVWTFTTGADLALAQHVSPTDNSTNEPITGVVLDWFDVANAASYEVQVSLDGSFNSNIIVYDTTSLINSNYTINTTLLNNTTYHWRVRSKNQDGYSFWSNPWSFTTIGNTTSIENYNNDLFQVYPVPSSGSINVKVNTNDDYSLKIYSANGEIIINKDNLTASLLNYNLEEFDKGLYFVRVSTLDNTIIKKIILN